MTKSSQFEQTLSKLREDYKNKLPDKIKEINDIWKELLQNTNPDVLSSLHLKIHSLHGNSATFGYSELSKTAGDIEVIVKSIVENPSLLPIKENEIADLLSQLGSHILPEEKETHVVMKMNTFESKERIIYLFDDDSSWGNDLIEKMTTFGYEILKFDEVEELINQFKNKPPAVAIININLVNNPLHAFLTTNNEKSDAKIPIIFVSTYGEFSLRLKAVRLGGEGYFVKPFSIDDFIDHVDHLVQLDVEPYHILIVDDENEVAQYYSAILQEANMKTCIINKSKEIDRALHEFNPDLILIDLFMPDCNGLELAAIIRQQSMYESTPIIYLSAEEDKLKQLNAMKLGADGFVTKSTNPEYLIMTIRNRVERYKKIRSLMVRDNLTGLYNHSFILNQLDIELKESTQLHNPLSIAIIDLDRFKNINDTYGHQAGDHVLRNLGLMIKKRLHVNDIVGRYNGENFLVILPNISSSSAKETIDALRKQFMTLNYVWNQQIFNASFSAGIASFPDFHTAAELLQAANESLAKSKKLGRNCVEVAT